MKTPTRLVVFRGRYLIRDAGGVDLFEIKPIRPSLEAWKQLQDYGQAICNFYNTADAPKKDENKTKARV